MINFYLSRSLLLIWLDVEFWPFADNVMNEFVMKNHLLGIQSLNTFLSIPCHSKGCKTCKKNCNKNENLIKLNMQKVFFAIFKDCKYEMANKNKFIQTWSFFIKQRQFIRASYFMLVSNGQLKLFFCVYCLWLVCKFIFQKP